MCEHVLPEQCFIWEGVILLPLKKQGIPSPSPLKVSPIITSYYSTVSNVGSNALLHMYMYLSSPCQFSMTFTWALLDNITELVKRGLRCPPFKPKNQNFPGEYAPTPLCYLPCTLLMPSLKIFLNETMQWDRQASDIILLNPNFFSLKTTFNIHMPLMLHISISVRALTPKLNPSPLPAWLVTLTMPTH